jgi:hypothetical protein
MRAVAFAYTLIACMTLSATCVLASEGTRLVFSGSGLIGEAADNQKYFPNILGVINNVEEDGTLHINREITSRLTEAGLSYEVEATHGSGNLSFALVFTWENISINEVGGHNRAVISLQAQALFFDFDTKRVMGAYPFTFQRIDLISGGNAQAFWEANFAEIIYGAGGVIDEFVRLVSENGNKTYGGQLYLGVEVLEPTSDVADNLSKYNISTDYAVSLWGFSFERYLSRNGGVAVVPYMNDQVIGGLMTVQMNDASLYQLQLPTPDYVFKLSIVEYRVIELERTSAEVGYGFASYIDVDVVQPLTQRSGFKNTFRLPVIAKFSTDGATGLDHRRWFSESVFSLADNLTSSLSDENFGWIEQWAVNDFDHDEIRGVNEILNRALVR